MARAKREEKEQSRQDVFYRVFGLHSHTEPVKAAEALRDSAVGNEVQLPL